MEFIWILFAFILGLAAKALSFPPSIGYLAAGFALNYFGFSSNDSLQALADLGITLLLFTIGLKLNVRDLAKTEVWLGSISHSVIWLVASFSLVKLFSYFALSYFSDLSNLSALIIAFALSFSSTVCVVKLLEESGEMRARHGKLAIGVLVIQDIIAVGFLVAATGKFPSVFALGLVAVFFMRPVIFKIVDKAGHGELIPLTGFFLALGSYGLFELVNIKGDLGALVAGMFLASHAKASEINKSLLSFKDLFLIGFFLTIGFSALPTMTMAVVASVLFLLIPIKFLLFFGLFYKLKLRARTSFLSALALSNFSEFGLIVAAISVKSGWLTSDWLVILSIAVTLSFIFTSIVYKYSHHFFTRYKDEFHRFESKERLPEDVFEQPDSAPIVVVGLGRVGIGAFKALDTQLDKQAWGLDADLNKVTWLREQGLNAYAGDAEDIDFWDNVHLDKIKLVLIAVPSVQDCENIVDQLKAAHYSGRIAAIARFEDEREQLENYGIDKVFNYFNEVGVGLAEESMAMVKGEL